MLQTEKIVRIGVFLAQLRDSSANAHEIKIRAAKKILDLAESYIEEEVNVANTKPKEMIGHLSWAQIASLMELSRGAVYARYSRVYKPNRIDREAAEANRGTE